ncbi:hypothetical protein QBC34DRAFT_404692 [Podospora aff. communis PSN243]|uniref:Fucose-specific lectin n=1 Tax=Podospora aff. communis PSN243 TaxID=3040156 RepID=A0AAV9GMC7_9PEZI|nr:hypothetical protein QBC34DRAFT_404692 [Podospora aff. communis PSN243]
MERSILLASRRYGRLQSLFVLFFSLVLGVAQLAADRTVSLALAHYDELNFQFFRLDASGDLLFQQSINASWQAVPEKLSLAVAPKPNSPLAAISWSPSASDGDTQVRLYYLDDTDKINELAGACKNTVCTWKASNSVIGGPASPSSGLAAALVGSPGKRDGMIKVFYVDANSLLSEATYAGGSVWAESRAIGPKVSLNSSPAAAAEASSANFQVYYYGADADGTLTHASFNNATQKWSTGTAIKPFPSASELPSLAAVHLPGARSHRVYFINSARKVEAYASTDNGATWSNLPQTAELTPLADAAGAPIAATAWATKVRIMYNTVGQIKEMSMKGTGQFYLMGEFGIHAAAAGGTSNTGTTSGKTSNGTTSTDGDGGTRKTDPNGDATDNTDVDGKKEEEKPKEEPGGWSRGDIIGLATGLPAAVFTIAGVIWKWKWLQKTWSMFRASRFRKIRSYGV